MTDKPGRRVIGAPENGVKVSISDEVLEEIAIIEINQADGVATPAEGDSPGMFRRHTLPEVALEVDGQNVVYRVKFSVRGGARIPAVATEVRQRIATAVDQKTGFAVRAVHVLVDRVVYDDGGHAEGS